METSKYRGSTLFNLEGLEEYRAKKLTRLIDSLLPAPAWCSDPVKLCEAAVSAQFDETNEILVAPGPDGSPVLMVGHASAGIMVRFSPEGNDWAMDRWFFPQPLDADMLPLQMAMQASAPSTSEVTHITRALHGRYVVNQRESRQSLPVLVKKLVHAYNIRKYGLEPYSGATNVLIVMFLYFHSLAWGRLLDRI